MKKRMRLVVGMIIAVACLFSALPTSAASFSTGEVDGDLVLEGKAELDMDSSEVSLASTQMSELTVEQLKTCREIERCIEGTDVIGSWEGRTENGHSSIPDNDGEMRESAGDDTLTTSTNATILSFSKESRKNKRAKKGESGRKNLVWDASENTTSIKAVGDASLMSNYAVKFYDGDGRVIASQSVTEGGYADEPDEPDAPEGKSFYGWYINCTNSRGDGFKYVWEFGYDEVRENLNFYPYFVDEDSELLQVSFYITLNEENYELWYSELVEDGHTVSKPSSPIMDGYNFYAWSDCDEDGAYDDEDLEDVEEFDFTTAMYGDLDLYAVFTVATEGTAGGESGETAGGESGETAGGESGGTTGGESGEAARETEGEAVETGRTCTIKFDVGDSYDTVPDQLVPVGGKITEPPVPSLDGCEFYGWFREEYDKNWDPDGADANAYKWNFETDVVAGDMTLYAYFLPVYMFSNSFQLQSSTGKTGYWTETVIGQGCKIKLNLIDQSGVKLKNINNEVSWNIVARPNKEYNWRNVNITNDANLEKFFKVKKNGVVKCKKQAAVGYQVAVVAAYGKNRAYYIMTVMPKIKKFGYVLNGKIKSSIKVTLTRGSDCEFGYGPLHFLNEGNYARYYDKNNASVGVALYQQPNGSSWWWPNGKGLTSTEIENRNILKCSAKIPKKAAAAMKTKSAPTAYGGYATLYYFPGTKGSYSVTYIAPDGSGKKFKLKFKLKKPKKVKAHKTVTYY